MEILAKRKVDFEYDGEMAADVALDREKMKLYPFCRLSDVANVLIMPAIHSASISTYLTCAPIKDGNSGSCTQAADSFDHRLG